MVVNLTKANVPKVEVGKGEIIGGKIWAIQSRIDRQPFFNPILKSISTNLICIQDSSVNY